MSDRVTGGIGYAGTHDMVLTRVHVRCKSQREHDPHAAGFDQTEATSPQMLFGVLGVAELSQALPAISLASKTPVFFAPVSL